MSENIQALGTLKLEVTLNFSQEPREKKERETRVTYAYREVSVSLRRGNTLESPVLSGEKQYLHFFNQRPDWNHARQRGSTTATH